MSYDTPDLNHLGANRSGTKVKLLRFSSVATAPKNGSTLAAFATPWQHNQNAQPVDL